jgi:hypothetical protein
VVQWYNLLTKHGVTNFKKESTEASEAKSEEE